MTKGVGEGPRIPPEEKIPIQESKTKEAQQIPSRGGRIKAALAKIGNALYAFFVPKFIKAYFTRKKEKEVLLADLYKKIDGTLFNFKIPKKTIASLSIPQLKNLNNILIDDLTSFFKKNKTPVIYSPLQIKFFNNMIRIIDADLLKFLNKYNPPYSTLEKLVSQYSTAESLTKTILIPTISWGLSELAINTPISDFKSDLEMLDIKTLNIFQEFIDCIEQLRTKIVHRDSKEFSNYLAIVNNLHTTLAKATNSIPRLNFAKFLMIIDGIVDLTLSTNSQLLEEIVKNRLDSTQLEGRILENAIRIRGGKDNPYALLNDFETIDSNFEFRLTDPKTMETTTFKIEIPKDKETLRLLDLLSNIDRKKHEEAYTTSGLPEEKKESYLQAVYKMYDEYDSLYTQATRFFTERQIELKEETPKSRASERKIYKTKDGLSLFPEKTSIKAPQIGRLSTNEVSSFKAFLAGQSPKSEIPIELPLAANPPFSIKSNKLHIELKAKKVGAADYFEVTLLLGEPPKQLKRILHYSSSGENQTIFFQKLYESKQLERDLLLTKAIWMEKYL